MSLEEEVVETPIIEPPPVTESSSAAKCDLQCLHHGDRVCYNDKTDKQIMKTLPEDSLHSSSSSASADSVHSGESLFKTFSFEGRENDPDMEKCMTFWKSILAKNVKPLKCNLMKTKNKEKAMKKEAVKKKPSGDKESEEVWLQIYQDLQRRKLDKLKLVKNKKCEPCIDITDDEFEKKQDVETIKKLNDWQPQRQSAQGSKIDVKSQVKRTLQVLKTAKAALSSTDRVGSTTRQHSQDMETSKKLRSTSDVGRGSKHSSATRFKKKSDAKVSETPKKSLEEPTPEENTAGVKPSYSDCSVEDVGQSNTEASAEDPKELNEQTGHKPVLEEPTPKKQTGRSPRGSIEAEMVERHQSNNPTQEEEKSNEICGNCGCDCVECVCAEMGDCLGCTPRQDKKSGVCYPCECSDECVCNLHMEGSCKIPEVCTCGCAVQSCTCRNFGNELGCSCGCGVEDCMCQQLFTKSCKCGHSDCDCDVIKALNAYLESLETPGNPAHAPFRGIRVASEESQTEPVQTAAATEKPTRYCVICGHFDCNCEEPK